MIKKAYFEITNVCNLHCSFCPGTKRKKGFVSLDDFKTVADKLKGRIPYLYLHLMGEPTIHPQFSRILDIAADCGFKVIITTNGTTLKKVGQIIIKSPAVYKVSISLHSFEANENNGITMDEYLLSCFDFCKSASEKGIISVMRLWNLDSEYTEGKNSENGNILAQMKQYFENEWVSTRSGHRLSDKIFLEWGEKFDWPDPKEIENLNEDGGTYFCHGLRDQIGILCDGTVVPCCLDGEGTINLGNIFDSTLDEILESQKAKDFYDSFTAKKAPHPLCRTCGYAKRFTK